VNTFFRTVVGAALAACFLVAIWFGGITFAAAIAIVALTAQWEFYGLGRMVGQRPYRLTGMAATAALLAWTCFFGLDALALVVVLASVFAILGIHPFLAGAEGRDWRDAALSVTGYLYIALPAAVGIAIRNERGLPETLFLFACIWAFDIMAFFTGKLLGRHRIFSRISPSKTWEGFAGGLVFAVGVGLALNLLLGWPWLKAGVIAGIIALVGHLGDFFESAIKRDAGAKDSSGLLPGHGGVLDRIDALLFAGPTFYLLLLIWK